MGRKKSKLERKAAHQAYLQSVLNREITKLARPRFTPGQSITLEKIGNVRYAGEIDGKDTFVRAYDPENQQIQEIALRPAALLVEGDSGYNIKGKSTKRTVPLCPTRHKNVLEYFLSKGGTA